MNQEYSGVYNDISSGKVMVLANFSLPDDMKFGEAQIIAITAYSVMFIVGFTLNSISLYNMLVERMLRRNTNRMSLLLIHLAVADLMVRISIRFPLRSLSGVWGGGAYYVILRCPIRKQGKSSRKNC